MKLSTLTYFVEVANDLSFTDAAQRLFISQPTLSRHIAELESELGVALFVRQSHSLKLTSDGEKFLIEATDVLERVHHLAHLFDHQTTDSAAKDILRIGYLANFNLSTMYELLNQFKLAHPNVEFMMHHDSPTALAEGVTAGKYDLVFNLSSYFQSKAKIVQSDFMANHLQIAMPVHHHLSLQQQIHFADLKDETFVLLERVQSPVIVDYVISQGLKNGFNLKANYYVNNLDEGMSLVALGKGLAFLYSGMNYDNLEQKYPIKIADLADNSLDQNVVCAIDAKHSKDTVRELFELLKAHRLEGESK